METSTSKVQTMDKQMRKPNQNTIESSVQSSVKAHFHSLNAEGEGKLIFPFCFFFCKHKREKIIFHKFHPGNNGNIRKKIKLNLWSALLSNADRMFGIYVFYVDFYSFLPLWHHRTSNEYGDIKVFHVSQFFMRTFYINIAESVCHC